MGRTKGVENRTRDREADLIIRGYKDIGEYMLLLLWMSSFFTFE
jgi:hypothetical protein